MDQEGRARVESNNYTRVLKMAGSGPTLDIGMLDEDIEDVDGVDDEGHEAWGRLFPLGKGLKGLGTILASCL